MSKEFWRGVVFFMCYISLRKDWDGLEKSLELMRENWTDAKYTVPLALAGLIWSVWTSLKAEK